MTAAKDTVVIGATGILAPLVRDLGSRGVPVTAVARRAGPAPGARRFVAADATSPAGVEAIAAAGPYDAAVLYGPATAADGAGPASGLLAAVTGPAVLVVTSAAADPDEVNDPGEVAARRRPRAGDPVLLLGWTGRPGATRWHDAGEVSAAALHSLLTRRDGMLGRVRPWNERPGEA